MDDVLFTVKETAKLLKCNVDTVHKLRKAGLLPFMKLGSYKIRKQALNDFLENFEGKNIDL
jgi:excisionase family DNA binding protein